MEALNRARRPVRKELNKLIDEMTTLLGKQPVDKTAVKIQYNMILEAHVELAELDRKVKELMVETQMTEEGQDDEYAKMREYKLKVQALRIQMEEVFPPMMPLPEGSSTAGSVCGDGGSIGVRLPKFEFKKFGGNLIDWLSFWAQFSKVDKHPNLEASDKFGYLLMQMEEGSEAFDIVNAFPQTSDNYLEAVEALKRRFGNPDVLLQVYIRELLKLVISNVDEKEKLPFPNLYTKVDSHLRALKSLNLANADPATWLFPLVESCLPEEILLTWMRSPESKTDCSQEDPPRTRLDMLMEFLGREVENRQRIGIAQGGFRSSNVEQKPSQQKRKYNESFVNESRKDSGKRRCGNIPTVAAFQNVEKSNVNTNQRSMQHRSGPRESNGSVSCIFCKKLGHSSKHCRSAKYIPFEDRMKTVAELKLCFKCLGRHYARDCGSKIRCQMCGKDHCLPLCKQFDGKSNRGHDSTHSETADSQSVQITQSKLSRINTCPVALQTLVAVVKNGEKQTPARIFFDGGSQRSYILKSLVENLNLSEQGSEMVAHELFGGKMTGTLNHNLYKVLIGSMANSYGCEIVARDQITISKSIPRIPVLPKNAKSELKSLGITLLDVGAGEPPVDILIGADYFGHLLTGNVQRLSNGYVAVETKLGWTLLGEEGVHFREWEDSSTSISMSVADFSVTQLWDLDTIGVRDSTDVVKQFEEDRQAKEFLFKTIKQNSDGRYVVRLPWREGHPALPSNYQEAEKRLRRTTKKLTDSGMFELYNKLFQEWEAESFIEEVEDAEVSGQVHYIPHRAVVKPDSMTTPVRPVFDASCKIGRAPSLNDCLYKGPNYIQLIPDILLRFREHKIGFVADIRKAFQMIEVDENDRDVMRFLWWHEDESVKIYRHRRVMFGANCSPFILGAVLDFHLTNLTVHKDVGSKLLKTFYVDNCCSSEPTIDDYRRFRDVSTKLLADCGMDLRMWMSNIDELDDSSSHTISVLGMMWDRIEDQLFVKVEDIQLPNRITKREVLSATQKIFDPIGYTSPAVIPVKCIMQKAWINKLKWDEALPKEEADLFTTWIRELHFLQKVRIPRQFIHSLREEGEWSLHTFVDGSSTAYACATYLRVEKDAKVEMQLLGAKARVAPIKKVTIPRLELLGCLIGARLCTSIKAALGLEGINELYWCDSTTALAWIQRDNEWKTFVGNRTTEINRLTKKENWKHVPGHLNPADLPSRGCSPSHLYHSCWWKGPSWLMECGSNFVWNADVNEEEIAVEMKEGIVRGSTISMSLTDFNGKMRSFVSWVRVWSYVKRFINNCKAGIKRTGYLSNVETSGAELSVIMEIQKEAYGNSDSSRFKGLDVFTDTNGLLCVKTRTIWRKDLIVSNTPYVLPGNHPLVRSLILYYHRVYAHAGVGFLVSKLRKRYWITQARKSVRFVVSKCYKCRKMCAKPVETETAPLPLDRIKDAQVFEVVGVDLAGPLLVKPGRKVWMVIFTCAVYRAVYLDLIDSLSTRSFIKCLGKFIEIHGRPAIIYSDNGTNFRGADNLFQSLNWDEIERDENIRPIKWKFNPPSGPWWGAWWERLIRTIKDMLRRSVGQGSLTRKELDRTLKVIASVMNDRPLTYVAETTEDLEPLTPNMFLKPSARFQFPEGDLTEGDRMRLRYQYMKTLWTELKQRFQREYLAFLVSKSRKKPSRPLRVGELVVVGDDKTKRVNWPLARILELYEGRDGVSRVAKIRMSDGECVRPVQRLYPLEVDGDSKEGHHMQTRSKSN